MQHSFFFDTSDVSPDFLPEAKTSLQKKKHTVNATTCYGEKNTLCLMFTKSSKTVSRVMQAVIAERRESERQVSRSRPLRSDTLLPFLDRLAASSADVS